MSMNKTQLAVILVYSFAKACIYGGISQIIYDKIRKISTLSKSM